MAIKTKKLLCLSSSILMALGLAACSGSNSSNTKTDKIKVVFAHTFGDKIETALQREVTTFQNLVKENEGVDVEISLEYYGAYTDMVKKVTSNFANGTSPTMAVAYPDHIAEYLDFEKQEKKSGKYVVNMQPYMDSDEYGYKTDAYLGDTKDESDFIEAFLEEGRQFEKEGTYLMPYMKSSEVMIYNLDAVTKALSYYDSSVPSGKVREYMDNITWDQLLELAQVAMDHKEDIASNLENAIFYDSDSNLFISKLYQMGIGYSSIGEDGTGVIDFESGENNTKAKAFVQSLKDAHDNHLFTTKATEGTYASDAFKKEKCIFTIGSSGGAGYTFPDTAEMDIGICKVPASNNNPMYISQGPSITFLNRPGVKTSENELMLKYAWKFYKYITSTDVNIKLCVTGSEGYIPVKKSSYSTRTYAEFLEEGGKYAECAQVLDEDIDGNYLTTAVFKGSAELRNQVGGIIGYVLKGTASVDEAFETAINNAKKSF